MPITVREGCKENGAMGVKSSNSKKAHPEPLQKSRTKFQSLNSVWREDMRDMGSFQAETGGKPSPTPAHDFPPN